MDEIYKNLSLGELLRDHQGKSDSWYWIGMAYFESRDYTNAAKWFEKTMNDSGDHGWQGKSTLMLGVVYKTALNRKEEALRLFESLSGSALAKMEASFMYLRGEGTAANANKALQLIEDAISGIIAQTGNDNYFAANECSGISEVFYVNGKLDKAKEYLRKTVDRCDPSFPPDRELRAEAEHNLRQLGG